MTAPLTSHLIAAVVSALPRPSSMAHPTPPAMAAAASAPQHSRLTAKPTLPPMATMASPPQRPSSMVPSVLELMVVMVLAQPTLPEKMILPPDRAKCTWLAHLVAQPEPASAVTAPLEALCLALVLVP